MFDIFGLVLLLNFIHVKTNHLHLFTHTQYYIPFTSCDFIGLCQISVSLVYHIPKGCALAKLALCACNLKMQGKTFRFGESLKSFGECRIDTEFGAKTILVAILSLVLLLFVWVFVREVFPPPSL